MEEKKNSNTLVVVLSVLVGILLVVCLLLGYMVVTGSNNESENNEQQESVDKKDDDVGKELSIDDEQVVNLFSLVHEIADGGIDDWEVYENKKLLVKDMSASYRAKLVYNVYKDKLTINSTDLGDTYFVKEADVREAYVTLFGAGYYDSSVPAYCGLCCEMKYDSAAKIYTGVQGACGVTMGDSSYEEIIGAIKYSDRIEITSVAWFNLLNKGGLYKDLYGNEKIDAVYGGGTDEAIEESFNNFVNSYKDELQQYTYTFKLNENGSYNYYGVERTKN